MENVVVPDIRSGFDATDGKRPVDASVVGDDVGYSGGFGGRHEVGLGEVDAVGLVYLERSQEQGGIELRIGGKAITERTSRATSSAGTS